MESVDGQDFVRPVWKHISLQYKLTEEGLLRLQKEYDENAIGAKRLPGQYADLELDTISRQLQQAELVQTIHRAHITRRDVDV